MNSGSRAKLCALGEKVMIGPSTFPLQRMQALLASGPGETRQKVKSRVQETRPGTMYRVSRITWDSRRAIPGCSYLWSHVVMLEILQWLPVSLRIKSKILLRVAILSSYDYIVLLPSATRPPPPHPQSIPLSSLLFLAPLSLTAFPLSLPPSPFPLFSLSSPPELDYCMDCYSA